MIHKLAIHILLLIATLSMASAQDTAAEVKNTLTNLVTDEANRLATKGLASMLPEGSNVEVSIGSSETPSGKKLSGHAMFVAPIKQSENGVLFNQSQIGVYNVRGSSRATLNFGLGYRLMSKDETYFTGINSFFDIDAESNTRMSVGLEFKASNFGANTNVYRRVGKSSNKVGVYTERVLNGYDMSIIGTLPYMPWADVAITRYQWDKFEANRSSKGTKLAAELRLNNNIKFEFGVDDNNIDKKNSFATLMFTFPGDRRPTLADGVTSKKAFVDSNVMKDLLMKVRRNNRIVLESKRVGVVMVRLD